MALHKKHKRLLAYVAILGGAAVLALTFFTISQFEKAKYQSSVAMQLMCDNKYTEVNEAYLDSHPEVDRTDEVKAKTAVLDDTSEESKDWREAGQYWNEAREYFIKVTDANSAAYAGTAIPAYLFSMSTLVAFGLILKHAEKAKEKEDEEEVTRQMH